MTTTVKELTQKVMSAWDKKDEKALRELLHPDYVCKDPMGVTVGIDKTIDKMMAFNFESDLEVSRFVVQDNFVVVEGDWIVHKPFKAKVMLATTMMFEDGLLKEKAIYFDMAPLKEAAMESESQK